MELFSWTDPSLNQQLEICSEDEEDSVASARHLRGVRPDRADRYRGDKIRLYAICRAFRDRCDGRARLMAVCWD
jgi:hypothetical protein